MIAFASAMAVTLFMIVHLAAVALYLHRLGRPAPKCGQIGQPFVTLLRPVCGLDPFDAETLRSSFRQDYPHYEIIFCAWSPDDPAIGLVQRLIGEHPDVPARLLIGHDSVTGNPKLNNVWKGWHASTSDWVCMTDSNLLLPRYYLSVVVASWGPKTGLVSSPPVGVRPQNLAGHLECAFLNGNQAVLQYASASLGSGFAQGKTLFFNKPLLEAAGGLRLLGSMLAEDAAATKVVRNMGREVTLTPLPFSQPIGKRRLTDVWARQLRWSRVRRDAFPLLFACEILNGGASSILFAVLAVALSQASPMLGLGYIALWYLAEVWLCRRAGWPLGWHSIALFVLRDMMIPMIWLATYARRGFEWRGNTLTPEDPLTPQPPLQEPRRAVPAG